MASGLRQRAVYVLSYVYEFNIFDNMATTVMEFTADQTMYQLGNFAIRLVDYFATMVKF